ncbi:MAG: FAD:protein FMN transferase [Clostridia bacterium]|nr:FAD:protein FMN transferase [Clostridia bacterium]
MIKKIQVISLLMLCFMLCSCAPKKAEKQIFAMDTVMNLTVYSDNADEILSQAAERIFELNRLLDRKSPSSEIYQLNKSSGGKTSPYLKNLIEKSISLSAAADGCFDITVAPLMDLWGFYDGSFHVPSEAEIKTALHSVGSDRIALNGNNTALNGTQLDLGAIAKGAASDEIINHFKENGVRSALISLGGNVYAMGRKPNGDNWHIAIADPLNPENTAGLLTVENKAVITSGIYQRNFTENGVLYHHIIDPKTGRNPENDLASVTVIGESGTDCDALSTAFFVMGIDNAKKYLRSHAGIDAVFIDRSGNISITPGLDGSFETEHEYSVIED